MKSFRFNYIFLFVVTIFITSCDKDPVIPNEEELITDFQYILTPAGGGALVILSFDDPDGDGGVAPIITGGVLQSNHSYAGEIILSNTSVQPNINISDEVDAEREEHQFFFLFENLDVQVSYNDVDADGNPVGLSTLLSTANSSEGNLKIILRHMPEKFASGVAEGDIDNAGGETDIEVIFPLRIQ